MELTLAQLAVKEKAKIIGFAKGVSSNKQKLMSMGVIRGTECEVVRVAPLGDPVEIIIKGYSLSLRKDEAESILIEKV